jgi:hypothetical protein
MSLFAIPVPNFKGAAGRVACLRVVCALLLLSPLLATGGSQFILIDQAWQGHGPYRMERGTTVLNGAFRIDPRGSSVTVQSVADENASWGPFFFTNQATVTIGAATYRIMLTTSDFQNAYEVGLSTLAMRRTLQTALTNDDARAGIGLIEAELAANRLFRGPQVVSNALTRLVKQAAQDDVLRASGKVKFENYWIPAAEAERLKQKREDDRMQAQGLVKMDGEWLTIDAARTRRLEQAKAEAQKAAAALKQHEQTKCRRCNGTGAIYFEVHPGLTAPNTRDDAMARGIRIEKPGLPPKDSTFKIERDACPACNGSGKRK